MKNRHEIQPGDRVLLLNAQYFTERDGTIGLVLTGLRYARARNLHTLKHEPGFYYYVQLPDGTKINALPHQVRKIGGEDDLDRTVTEDDLVALS